MNPKTFKQKKIKINTRFKNAKLNSIVTICGNPYVILEQDGTYYFFNISKRINLKNADYVMKDRCKQIFFQAPNDREFSVDCRLFVIGSENENGICNAIKETSIYGLGE